MERAFLGVLAFRRVSYGVVRVQQQELICRQAAYQRQLGAAYAGTGTIFVDVPASRYGPKLVLAVPIVVAQTVQRILAEMESCIGTLGLFGHIFPGLVLVFALSLHCRKPRREGLYAKNHDAHPHNDNCITLSSCLGLSSLAFFGFGTGFATGSFFDFAGAAGLGAAGSCGLMLA